MGTHPDPVRELRRAIRFARRELAPTADRVEGITLALYRQASGVTAADIASRLNVSKQGLSQMEDRGCTVERAGWFRAAVDQSAAEE